MCVCRAERESERERKKEKEKDKARGERERDGHSSRVFVVHSRRATKSGTKWRNKKRENNMTTLVCVV